MNKRASLPTYRHHKQSGQAIVTLTDGFGGRRDVLLGKYGTAASRRQYDRAIAEWIGNGRRLRIPLAAGLSVNELALAYWNHSRAYHGWSKHDGYNLKDALRIVKTLYGHESALDFGPIALKACRQQMMEKDWSRTYINRQASRIVQMFKWAAGEEMLPASVHDQLATVPGLAKGKTTARETKPIKPVAQRDVDATLPFMPPAVQALVHFQLLTGCRPAEACILRPIDIDMRNPACWVYKPQKHKTEHHDQDRIILIGPRAQEVLRPFLGTRVDAYCFSPLASEAERSAKRRQERKSPMTPSQAKRRPKRNRKRPLRACYDTTSYRNAVQRACEKADAKAHADNPALPAAPPLVPVWAPNQLRHTRATELRRHGLDVTKTILGHTKVETTQIYAEKDIAAAMELVAKIG